ncbi:MAG: hypothetical protein J0L84_10190 [Verrucomicrobia bacterium]|nr:hypothetical protein [Verrucomicrobiota bacterium]
MVERLPRLLSLATVLLLGVLVFEVVGLMVRRNPLDGVHAPAVPHWQVAESNAPVEARPATVSTQQVVLATNVAALGTNSPAPATNTPSLPAASAAAATNIPRAAAATNAMTATNPPALGGTNSATATAPPVPPGGPGPMAMRLPPGVSPGSSRRSRPPPPPPSPLLQARMDRITQSEILAPVFRPPPMALLGIAGRDAFIRTPSGQSALLREGGESDGIKLLRLGTNRVLIEQAGEKKELMIYEGFGGESLLPK